MNIRELAASTGVSPRQIRFLISEGFVPPPRGGRSNADYGDDHEAAICWYMALKAKGLPPAAIRILLENDIQAAFPVMPGISLHIDPKLLGGPIDQDLVLRRIRSVLENLDREPPDADSPTRSPNGSKVRRNL